METPSPNAVSRAEPVSVRECDDPTLIAAAWTAGDLSYKLDAHQLRVYVQYRDWEKRDPFEETEGQLVRVFVLDIARRWGKTLLCLLIKIEDAIAHPGANITYATAFQKDIAEILIPLFEIIVEDAPDHLRPSYHQSKEGEAAGFYFPNGSRIKVVGVDKNPRGLRGRGSDGFVVSEAAHVRNLEKTLRAVVLPQFQRRPHARMILESNAPEDPDHDFDVTFVPDAKVRRAYVFATLDDNEALSRREKEVCIREAGGFDSEVCQREYYGVRVRSKSRAIVPEWNTDKHERAVDVPAYAVALTAMDPGDSDHTGIVWGYIDFETARLVVQRSWHAPNASTGEIATIIGETEDELWHDSPPLQYWRASAEELEDNPRSRQTDVAPRLRRDLAADHGLDVAPVRKSRSDPGGGGIQAELRSAGIQSFRTAIQKGQIVAHPDASEFIAQMEAGRWNERHTDYERSERWGHFDCIDAAVVLWRMAKPLLSRNPYPPGSQAENPDDVSRIKQAYVRQADRGERDALLTLYGGGGKVQGKRGAAKRRRGNTWQRRKTR